MYRIAAYSRWFYCTPQTISTIPDGRRRITASAIGNKRIEIKTKVEAVLVSKKNNVFYPFSYLAWIRRSAVAAASFCWDEALAGRQKPCRARPNSHQDESLSGCRWHEKGTEVFYFCLLSVCILIICIGICVGFRCCVFSGFVYSPTGRENCAVGERRSRRPSGALFWRAFSADERRLWACFARNGPSLCHLQTIQRPRARSAVLSSLLQTDRARQPPFAFVLAAQP